MREEVGGGGGQTVKTLSAALSKYLPCHTNREKYSVQTDQAVTY